MSWLANLQKKSAAEKMRLLWAAIIVLVIFLIIVWVFSSKLHKTSEKDTTLFETIGQGVKDVQTNWKK